jgi:hypothetical protein
MKRLLELLSIISVIGLAAFFLWTHHNAAATPVAAAPSPALQSDAQDDNQPHYPEQQQAREIVTIVSPLADYMSRSHGGAQDTNDSDSPQPVASHISGSPVGTSNPILHKTFPLAKAADLPFEIPAHAATPKLHGIYHSFFQHAGPSDGDGADVEFLLLNQQQYSNFINQRPSDDVFSAGGAHDQEVNVNLPPTFNQPVKYYIVFRNGSNAGKVAVQADFRVDF